MNVALVIQVQFLILQCIHGRQWKQSAEPLESDFEMDYSQTSEMSVSIINTTQTDRMTEDAYPSVDVRALEVRSWLFKNE